MKKYLLAAALALAAILPARAQVAAPNVAVTWLPIGKMASGISVTTSASSAAALPAGGESLYIFNTGAQDAFVAIGGASVAASTTAGGSTLVKAGTCANINRRNQGNVVQNYISAITATSTTTLAVESGVGSASCSGGAGGGGGGGGGAITMASGAVAAGAYSSGSFASGAFASGSLAAGAMVDLLTMRQTVAAGTVASNSLLVGGIYNSSPITLTNGQGAANQFDANGYLKVNVAAGGAGGGAITAASGSYASGALSSGSIAAGALAAGAGVDGWDITQGAKADSACGSASGTCSLIALIKYLNTQIIAGTPAGTNLIGDVNLRQGGTVLSATNGAFFNQLQGNAVISAANPSFAAVSQGGAVLSATNGIYSNALQGNAVLSLTNPAFTRVTDGTTGVTVKATTTAPTTTDTALVSVDKPATAATPIAVLASDNHATLKNGAGVAMSVHTSNNSATRNYLRLYDAGTGFNGCNSATGVIFAMEIPPNDGGFSVTLGGGSGIAFTNGLSWCITSGFGLTDTTNATASAIYANASYK